MAEDEGEPRRNGAKHWTARRGREEAVALGDDVLDELGTPRRNGAEHWTARRGQEEEVEDQTRRCLERLDDAGVKLSEDSADAAG